jgi:hypothetical protein
MTCTLGSWNTTDLPYSSKIISAVLHRKVGGFLRVQLIDFILYIAIKVKYYDKYIYLQLNTHRLILHKH